MLVQLRLVCLRVAANGFGLGEEGEIVVQMIIKPQKPNRSTMFKNFTNEK